MKRRILPLLLALVLVGCQSAEQMSTSSNPAAEQSSSASQAEAEASLEESAQPIPDGAVSIELSDEGILVDGAAAVADAASAVYVDHDIVFYLAGQGFTYGEGSEADEHEQAEADEHTVVHITQPGTYALSGKLSQGQIAVDLGENAEEDPSAVVTLILNGVDISCTVAPGVIFYEVYECGSTDAETATQTVDTSAAGARVVIADDSVNTVNGSYVARIYKSYTLSEDGSRVVDSKKLHKYDGAFYSRMSMQIDGGENGTGVLNINAENEGLDSELHLTINGGNIHIIAGNDGINTNEDGVSVTTINGGSLSVLVNGATGEGDGIDSNGWIVINGGTVIAAACDWSADSGIDSDMGIYINGGTVVSTGNMLDRVENGDQSQTYVVLEFAQKQSAGKTYSLKNEDGESVFECTPANGFTGMILASDEILPGNYTLWQGETQLAGISSEDGMTSMPPRMDVPNGEQPQEPPEGGVPGEFMEKMPRPDGEQPPEPPEGGVPGEFPEGMQRPGEGRFGARADGEVSAAFRIEKGGNYFSGVSVAEM